MIPGRKVTETETQPLGNTKGEKCLVKNAGTGIALEVYWLGRRGRGSRAGGCHAGKGRSHVFGTRAEMRAPEWASLEDAKAGPKRSYGRSLS